MRVLKFGGTSVGSAARILEVIDILKDYKSQNIIFCSAANIHLSFSYYQVSYS